MQGLKVTMMDENIETDHPANYKKKKRTCITLMIGIVSKLSSNIYSIVYKEFLLKHNPKTLFMIRCQIKVSSFVLA